MRWETLIAPLIFLIVNLVALGKLLSQHHEMRVDFREFKENEYTPLKERLFPPAAGLPSFITRIECGNLFERCEKLRTEERELFIIKIGELTDLFILADEKREKAREEHERQWVALRTEISHLTSSLPFLEGRVKQLEDRKK